MQPHQLARLPWLLGLASAAVFVCAVFRPSVAVAQDPPPATGAATNTASPRAFFEEPRLLSKRISWIEDFGKDEQGRPHEGFYPELGKMITGAGWISIGPGYRHRLWGDRASMDTSAAISWRGYKVVLSDTAADADVPFYMLPSLGGSNTVRGFDDYRFHDRHLMVVNAESRWAIWPHVDAAAFFDAGSVAARVDGLDFGETSAGVGLRLHTKNKTPMRFDVARSHEG